MNPFQQKRINTLIVILIILSLIIGIHGWYVYFITTGKEIDFSTSLFLTLQLFTMNTGFEDINIPVTLNIARFLAPLSLASAIISAVAAATSQNLFFLRVWLSFKNHIIIVGLNSNSLILAKNLPEHSKKKKVIIIDTNPDAALWEEALQESITVVQHSYISDKILKAAGIRKAALLILNASDKENLNILQSSLLHKTAIKVIATVSDQFTFQKLKDIPSKSFDKADVHFSHLDLLVASQIVDDFSPDTWEPVSPEDKSVHIIIAGDQDLMYPLAEECGRMYHFANLKPLHITIVCNDTNSFARELNKRQPMFGKVVQIDYISIDRYNTISYKQECKPISLCFAAFRNFAEGVQMAQRLRQHFYTLKATLAQPAIILINGERNNIIDSIPGFAENLINLNISLVNADGYLSRKVVVENHEKYDIIAKFINNQFSLEILNDLTHANELWRHLSSTEKDYNRFPARHFHIKLRAIGASIVNQSDPAPDFDLDSVPDNKRLLLAQMEKNRWNAEKFLTGFIPGTYNEDKNLEKLLKKELKYHPALKTWEQISQEEKNKDFFAFNNIREILANAALRIVKK